MLSNFQLAKLPNLFHMFDSDKNGYLTKHDYLRIINGCAALRGWEESSQEYVNLYSTFYGQWTAITGMANKSDDGQVQLQEFLSFFDHLIHDEENYEMVINGVSLAIFGSFDLNDDGVLTADEYHSFYQVMGLDPALAPNTYKKLDLDSNGSISIRELSKLVDQFFSSQDPNAPGNELFGAIIVDQEKV
ncbi:MAG: EF-hand domain-containing protein [Anaerolineae bacterium]